MLLLPEPNSPATKVLILSRSATIPDVATETGLTEVAADVYELRLLIPFAADMRRTSVDQLVVTDVSADVVRGFLRHIEERRR